MRIPHGLRAALAAGSTPAPSGYQIARSLRFNSADSAYLSRTLGTPTNRNKWTFAFWLKPCFTSSSSVPTILGVDTSATSGVQFENTNQLRVGWSGGVLELSRVFRDFSAWYHVVISADVTNATTSSRLKIYVNGEDQESRYAIDNRSSLTASSIKINGSFLHYIGSNPAVSRTPDAYLAEVHFIDGQALTPTSFAETNATTGQWVPKAFSGTYGTNGFKLDFADNSNTTAGTLGKDTSGNGLNWTPSGFSVTAGAGNDSLVDTPTSYGTDTGAGGEVRGNYCTWNPLNQSGSNTLSNGNLDVVVATGVSNVVAGSFGVTSGKWYWEITPTAMSGTAAIIGIADLGAAPSARAYSGSGGWYYFALDGTKYTNNSGGAYGAAYAVNDVIGVALDMDAGTLTFYKNGVSQGVAYNSGLSGKVITPSVNNGTGTGSQTYTANFGQRSFSYTPPSGYKALCDTNLPTPAIAQPNTVMDVKLYTGNGSTQTISGLGFSPDLVWIKSRSAATAHELTDSVRGATKSLSSNTNGAEATDSQGLTAFNSDGFSLGTDTNYNNNTATYVAWCWDKSATPGFDIVTYTGNGASGRDIAHSLGVKPSMIITKARTDATYNWHVWHTGIGADYYLALNNTGVRDNSVNVFPYAGITSSSFRTSTAAVAYNNLNAVTYVAYLWSEIAGFSKFGSYTGNGSTDGPFVYTGFRPRWVMIKASSASGEWGISDAARDQYNVVSNVLLAETSGADNTGLVLMDFTSNGFKLRNSNLNRNTNGTTYIYAAFAQNPFQYARAR